MADKKYKRKNMYTLHALLPMKGVSERVPNKNMRKFNGKPLYHAIMDTLLKSKYIKKIVINTDSNTIAQDAKENFGDKVIIIERPKQIQGGDIPMNTIIDYDLQHIEGEHFLQTHSTNPLLTVTTLNKAIETYFENLDKNDSLFSVTKLQTRLYDKNGNPINHDPNKLLRTQDLEPLYEENSNFYIFSKTSFNKTNNRIGNKALMFEMNKLEAIDIDEPEDFVLAEIIYKNKDKIFKENV